MLNASDVSFASSKSASSRSSLVAASKLETLDARLKREGALPVADVAAKDCLLLMWTVSHLQDEASDLARAWGFTPKSLGLVWVKDRIGMGYWFRQEVEVMKLFTRGKPKRLSAGVRQAIHEPRREHSRKPDEQYERIERLVGGPYLEMFARQQRPGWTAWGNEIDRFTQPLDADLAELLGSPISANDDLFQDADIKSLLG